MFDRLALMGAKANDLVASVACFMNGREVDCATMTPFLGLTAIFFLLFWLFIMALFLATFIFWILMLIHAASKPVENRALWVVVIALFHFVGALVYYFVVKRPLDKKRLHKSTP